MPEVFRDLIDEREGALLARNAPGLQATKLMVAMALQAIEKVTRTFADPAQRSALSIHPWKISR